MLSVCSLAVLMTRNTAVEIIAESSRCLRVRSRAQVYGISEVKGSVCASRGPLGGFIGLKVLKQLDACLGVGIYCGVGQFRTSSPASSVSYSRLAVFPTSRNSSSW